MEILKNKISKIIAFLFAFVFVISCTDVELDEEPPSLLSPVTFYNSESDFEAALAGTFRPLYSSFEGFDYGFPLMLCAGGEDVKSFADIFVNFDRLNPNDQEIAIEAVWRTTYQSIANANAILGNIANADDNIEPERLAEIEGQTRFIRAFNFFNLVRWFGEIQLTTFENQNDILNVKQSTVVDIYDAIINDLKKAESQLPDSFSEKGRPTKGAAKTLLAKVYLTMAGWPLNDINKYALARDKAKEVIDAGLYGLEPDFADLWKESNKLTNREFIFTFYGSIASPRIGSHMHLATRSAQNGENGWGDFFSETRFFDAFPEGPRKDATFTSVFADGTTATDNGIDPFMAKYKDAGETVGNDGEGFNVMLRYADVLLMYAEAANMAEGGPSSRALKAINMVRRRANGLDINTSNPTYDLSTGLSKEEFDDAVIAERNWELAFELNRWFDLLRKEMVVEVNQDAHPNVSENNRLLPKPAAQLIPDILEQNPGY